MRATSTQQAKKRGQYNLCHVAHKDTERTRRSQSAQQISTQSHKVFTAIYMRFWVPRNMSFVGREFIVRTTAAHWQKNGWKTKIHPTKVLPCLLWCSCSDGSYIYIIYIDTYTHKSTWLRPTACQGWFDHMEANCWSCALHRPPQIVRMVIKRIPIQEQFMTNGFWGESSCLLGLQQGPKRHQIPNNSENQGKSTKWSIHRDSI